MAIAEITGALAAVKSSYELIKAARDIAKTLENAELQAHLAEVISNYAEIRVQLVEAEEKIRDLESALELKEELEFDPVEHSYFLKGKEDPSEGRYCSACWNAHNLAIRLTPTRNKDSSELQAFGHLIWACPHCKNQSSRTASGLTPYG